MRNNNRNSWSRRLAFQAIYSWSINYCSAENLISSFKLDNNYMKSNKFFFCNIVDSVISNILKIDQSISSVSEIKIGNINQVELSIIRCCIYEFTKKKIPYQILIAEYVKIANKFGGKDSYKFVNAFLENFAKKNKIYEIK